MNTLLALPLVLPLAAAVHGLLRTRHRTEQRTVSFLATAGVLGAGVALAAHTLTNGPVATQVGDFPAGIAIPLVADAWTALLLMVTGVVYLATLAFAAIADDDEHPAFHPLAQILLAGICFAFLTGDLFNLFVSFEVMLIASYVLSALGSGAMGRRATFTYIVVNLASSMVLLAGTGLVYATLGTVNLGVLAGLVPDQPGAVVALALPLTAFAVKAGLVPVNGWLAVTYPRISPAVAAMFSGLLTKVGIYALYRVVTLLLPDEPLVGVALGVVAAVTMGVGVLQAVGQGGVRTILSFHITSQVGYMVMGLALGGVAGLAAGIAYTIHHIVVKTSLFLSAGALEHREGTGSLAGLSGVARRAPGLALAFGIAAAGLAGLPPLSGFVPKLALLQVAFDRGWWLLGGISLTVSLLTLVSMLKIQTGVFWGSPPHEQPDERPDGRPDASPTTPARAPAVTAPATATAAETAPAVRTRSRSRAAAFAAPALVLAGVSVALGLAAGPLLEAATIAAEQLDDPAAYVTALLEAGRS